MKHFSRELALVLAGPPKLSQTDLCQKARPRLVRSKLCRLLQDRIACDRPTLDQILSAIPYKDNKRRLLRAYLQDIASPEALVLLTNGQDPWANLELNRLSPKGQRALRNILNSGHIHHLDRLIQDLATAFGLE